MNVFELDQLAVHYRGIPALQGVSLSVAPRAITAFIGPSGCGKSSLLGCLNRLNDEIPHCRVDGRVRLLGRSSTRQAAISPRCAAASG